MNEQTYKSKDTLLIEVIMRVKMWQRWRIFTCDFAHSGSIKILYYILLFYTFITSMLKINEYKMWNHFGNDPDFVSAIYICTEVAL